MPTPVKVTVRPRIQLQPVVQGLPIGLPGLSEYDLYLLTTADNPKLTLEEWLESRKGEDAILPENIVIDPNYVHTDNNYTASEKALVATIPDKVDKLTGYSLVADSEILKIHARNTDSTLLSENGQHSVYVDNSGVFHVKSISQVGTAYETHAEQLFTTKNEIILRDGAVAGLGVGEYVGFRAKLYDGVNDGHFVFDKDGWARVGDVGSLQKLATIEETTTNGWLMKYNASTLRLEGFNIFGTANNFTALQDFSAGLKTNSITKRNGSGLYKLQDGGTEWYTTKWFTPTGTFSSVDTAVTITGGQLTSAMVGAKIGVGEDKRVITAFLTSNTCTVDSAFSQDYSGVVSGSWGVYSKAFQLFFYGTYAGIKSWNSSGEVQIDGDIYGQFKLSKLATSDGTVEITNANHRVSNGYAIRWSNDGTYYGTKDTGIRRANPGLLEIFDGITNGTLRDLKLRSLYGDKIIPNSDTTGVVIRNAADSADVVKVDTANGIRINKFSNGDGVYIGKKSGYAVETPLALMYDGPNVEISGYWYNSKWVLRAGYYADRPTSIILQDGALNNGGYISYEIKGAELARLKSGGFFGLLTTTPETTIDINGTTTHRDWTYFNNGTHTGDAVGDFRFKVLSGVLTFQKCDVGNSTKGNGTWITVHTI